MLTGTEFGDGGGVAAAKGGGDGLGGQGVALVGGVEDGPKFSSTSTGSGPQQAVPPSVT